MRFILLGLLILFTSGCSQLQLKQQKEEVKRKKEFSCEEKAVPKSLLEIEQQYRCTSK